ncbi:MAG: isoprenylcysteine carboxylmethyltransferase family protein [Ignavibacteriota bacterium]
MTLKTHFKTSGAWLFSHRSYVPLVLLPLAALVMFFSHDYPQSFALHFPWKLLCLVFSLCGMIVRALVVGLTPTGTSGRNTEGQIADELNTLGIYSVVRHPLYIGNYIVVLGIVMWMGIWWFVLLASVLYWFYYERILYTEEEYLSERFGEQHEKWAAVVPAVIPSFRHYKPSALRFSVKNVLAREYDGFLAIATAFLILAGLEYYALGCSGSFEMFWPIFFAAIFIIAAILRWMRKKTDLLKVKGR